MLWYLLSALVSFEMMVAGVQRGGNMPAAKAEATGAYE